MRNWGGRGRRGDVRRVTNLEWAQYCMGYVEHEPALGNIYMRLEQSGDGFYDFVQIEEVEMNGVPGWQGVIQEDRIGSYGHIGDEEINRIIGEREFRLLAAGGIFVPLTSIPLPEAERDNE